MNDLRQMQLMLTDMLKVFHDFCLEHSLRYYAVGGTALGVARHQGFIPWDDDLDVGMPRPDYERFVELFNKENINKRYLLESDKSDDPLYSYTFSKLYDTSTTLIEIIQVPIKRGLYIDIFPLDGAGNSKKESEAIIRKVIFWQSIKKVMSVTTEDKKERSYWKKAVLTLFSKTAKRVFTFKYIRSKIDSLSRSFDYETSRFVVNYSGAYGKKEVVEKAFLGNPKLYTFEGIQVYCPEFMDNYLTYIYGDWKTPPPKEKQVTHHNYFLDLSKSYLE